MLAPNSVNPGAATTSNAGGMYVAQTPTPVRSFTVGEGRTATTEHPVEASSVAARSGFPRTPSF